MAFTILPYYYWYYYYYLSEAIFFVLQVLVFWCTTADPVLLYQGRLLLLIYCLIGV